MTARSHGGSRAGSGRAPNAEKHKAKIATFTERAAAYLPTAFENLKELAGKHRRVEEIWEPAGSITHKGVARALPGPGQLEGEIIRDAKGKPAIVDVPSFPDLDPATMVRTHRKVIKLPPDERANEFLVNRPMGTPIPAPVPDPELVSLREALTLVQQKMLTYRDPDQTPPPATEADEPTATVPKPA